MFYDESHHFGYMNAEDEQEIKPIFLEQPIIDHLKLGTSGQDRFIVIGAKGTGKTALRKHIAENFSDSHLVWTLWTTDDGVPTDPYVTPAQAQSVFVNFLLTNVISQVLRKKDDFAKGDLKPVTDLRNKLLQDSFKGLLSHSTVEGGFSFLRFHMPFDKANLPHFQKVGSREYKNALIGCLTGKPAILMLDDVEAVFPGIETSPALLEGLINAVAQLNRDFRETLSILLFLPTDFYMGYRKAARSADKARDHISFLAWENRDLVKVLDMRIRFIHNMRSQRGSLQLWKMEFSGSNSQIHEIQNRLATLCVNGPRDLILLCNMAFLAAQPHKIEMEYVYEVESDYSREKLIQLNQIWGHEYNDVSDAVQTAFHGIPVYEFDRDGFAQHWSSTAVNQLRAERGLPDYLNTSTRNVVRVLYDIGFLGFVPTRQSDLIYVGDMLDPGYRLDQAIGYAIHPAYRAALSP